jgi:3-hydroxyethyl bacteriochlorophyllide a dehydrogenase
VTDTLAVVFDAPEQLSVQPLALDAPETGEVVVDVEWTAISTGTERLLYTGQMPAFPGMGYPLVPGYETVGRIVETVGATSLRVGDRVFVPGANCYGPVRGLFGGAASRVVVPAARVTRIDEALGPQGVLLALAATAQHALDGGSVLPDLIVGHGALGRLLARIVVARGGSPVVWEKNEARAQGAVGYDVLDPAEDARRDYACICDVSGDSALLDTLVGRLARGGEIVLAGFYPERVGFSFPPAFIKEARFRVAAEWKADDLDAVLDLVRSGRLDLGELITHRRPFGQATDAYRSAFNDPACLKMILDWRSAD